MNLLSMSISAAVMVLGVLLIRRLGRKMISKNVIMCLWDLILLRTLVPFRIPLEKIPLINTMFSESEMTAKLADIPFPVAAGRIPVNAADSVEKTFGITEIVFMIWAVGAAVLIIWNTIAYFEKDKISGECFPTEDKAVRRIIRKSGLRRNICLYIHPGLVSAVTFGVIHPKILLPPNMDAMSEQDIENMVSHELQHIRTFDLLKRYILNIAVSVHWFNPMMWIMEKNYRRDQEFACDERVIYGKDRPECKAYATTLHHIEQQYLKLEINMAGFNKDNDTLARVKQVIHHKKMGTAGILLSILFLACSMMAFASYEPNVKEKVEESSSVQAPDRQETRTSNTERQTEKLVLQAELVEETEVVPVDIQAETEEMSQEEYESIIQDILENHNDPNQPFTKKQAQAYEEYIDRRLAQMFKEKMEAGEELTSRNLALVRRYYKE